MPPFIEVAVKVVDVPWQIAMLSAAILTDGVKAGFTRIVIILLLAIVSDKHDS